MILFPWLGYWSFHIKMNRNTSYMVKIEPIYTIFYCNNAIKNSLNGSNFDHIANIAVHFYMNTSIIKSQNQDWDRDRYRDQNLNGTRTNHWDQKWLGPGPGPIIGTNHRDQKLPWPGPEPVPEPVPVDGRALLSSDLQVLVKCCTAAVHVLHYHQAKYDR